MKIEKQNPGFAKRVKSWLTGKYVENGSTASQNIPAGKWVTWKGQVCKAKTAITTGDTLSATNLDTDEEGALNSNSQYYQVGDVIDLEGYMFGVGYKASASQIVAGFQLDKPVIPNAQLVLSKIPNASSFGINFRANGANIAFGENDISSFTLLYRYNAVMFSVIKNNIITGNVDDAVSMRLTNVRLTVANNT